MRILHVASFRGNVGDNANHNGIRNKLAKILPTSTQYDEIEIRRFYRHYDGKDKLYFDNHFVDLANQYDLVIIGGGNFFEVWIEESSTGCTIDMNPNVINTIKTKILFFGLGFDRCKGYSKKTLNKFLSFIESLQDQNHFMVTVRNDGSLEQFIESYGYNKSNLIHKVPDGGFFVKPDSKSLILINNQKKNIIISLAQDMLSVRFGKDNEKSGYKNLIHSLSKYIITMIEKDQNYFFTFMPHIYSDLEIINKVISILPDYIRRNYISVGPYVVGLGAEDIIFSNYQKADLVLAMRFHANVCSIGMGIPTIGLGTYKKIEYLYNELGLQDRYIESKNGKIYIPLIKKTNMIFDNTKKINEDNLEVMKKITKDMDNFILEVKNFLGIANE